MKRLFKIVFFFIFLSLGAYAIWTLLEKKPAPLTVLIHAHYAFSDRVQLFYAFEGDSTFIERRSINYKLTGSNNEQEIKFILPLSDRKLSGFRLDVSNNHNQNQFIFLLYPLRAQKIKLILRRVYNTYFELMNLLNLKMKN